MGTIINTPQVEETPPPPPPISLRSAAAHPISRSHDSNPCPTTFVQADTTTFKQVVQLLTGSSDAPPPSSPGGTIPPIKSTGQKKQGFKLYERRNSLKNGLFVNTLPLPAAVFGFSPRKAEILSPSILDFPALGLSPITPLSVDTLSKMSAATAAEEDEEEEKAIAEKKFYLHPSPTTMARDGAQPRLLPLFPVTSPRAT